MDEIKMGTILAFANIVVPWLAQAAMDEDVQDFVKWAFARIKDMVSGDVVRDPTEAEWEELNDRITKLRAKLHSDTE